MLAASKRAAKWDCLRRLALNYYWRIPAHCGIKRADDSLSPTFGWQETHKTHYVY
ncbi:MAG: hypothetical protein ACTS81_03170 [Arsenophonus sp. ER-BJ3-MAG3]